MKIKKLNEMVKQISYEDIEEILVPSYVPITDILNYHIIVVDLGSNGESEKVLFISTESDSAELLNMTMEEFIKEETPNLDEDFYDYYQDLMIYLKDEANAEIIYDTVAKRISELTGLDALEIWIAKI